MARLCDEIRISYFLSDDFHWPTPRRVPASLSRYEYDYFRRHRIKVWFDDVVLATEYIGPLAGGKQ